MADFDHAAFAQQNVANFLERSRREPKEAKFAAPEAAVTGLGVGAILGGPIGIVAGLAQGILGKRLRQSELDAIAAEQSAYDDVDAAARETIERNMQTATSPEDVEQLSTLATQQAAARRMLASNVPSIRQQGAALQSQIFAEQRAYAVRQEEQAIAAAAQDEAGRIAMGDQAWTRFQAIRDDHARDSASFVEQRAAYGRVVASARQPSPAGDIALIINYMKVLDPGSVVREGEFATAANAGGVPERIRARYNQLLNGERLTPDQRTDFVGQATEQYRSAVELQNERNTRVVSLARDAGVPGRFNDDLMIPTGASELPAPTAGATSTVNRDESGPGIAGKAAAGAAAAGQVALESLPDSAKAGLIGGATAGAGFTFRNVLAKAGKFAARIGAPVAAILAAAEIVGTRLPNETDVDYEIRLRQAMEGDPFESLSDRFAREQRIRDRRPTN